MHMNEPMCFVLLRLTDLARESHPGDNGADRGMVGDLYERTLRNALGGALLLQFESAGWADSVAGAR